MSKSIRDLRTITFLSLIREADEASLASMARTALCELAFKSNVVTWPFPDSFAISEHKPKYLGHDPRVECIYLYDFAVRMFPQELAPYRIIEHPESHDFLTTYTPAGFAWALLTGREK